MPTRTHRPTRSKKPRSSPVDPAQTRLQWVRRARRRQQELRREAHRLARAEASANAGLRRLAELIAEENECVILPRSQYQGLLDRIDEIQRRTATLQKPTEPHDRVLVGHPA